MHDEVERWIAKVAHQLAHETITGAQNTIDDTLRESNFGMEWRWLMEGDRDNIWHRALARGIATWMELTYLEMKEKLGYEPQMGSAPDGPATEPDVPAPGGG